MDNAGENEDDDDGGRGMEAIGIKILEGTTVSGLSRTSGLVELEHSDAVHVESFGHTPKTVALLHKHDHLFAKENLSSAVVSGLWDDLCFLLSDDYEKLAPMEAYDASRAPVPQEQSANTAGELSNADGNDPSSVRVPPTAHIRKHAARLFTTLSLSPKFQKTNLTQWSGASLPVQVFYSCPHFGSKLADMPWRIGLVLRPAPSVLESTDHINSCKPVCRADPSYT
ncbi:hypothetical protein NC652_015191 [Populus alba x Populus x berolinensis]|nr:hypothetical protein NC652_015191 [Populus alba x Populus x berolinensis]